MYADWGREARARLAEIERELGPDATLEQHRKAVRAAAGDFHGGTSWGKKVWSKEGRKYLERHGLPPRTIADASPQSKLFAKAQSGDIIFPFRGEGETNGEGLPTR